MPTVRCLNPACGREVPLPADTPPGKVYGCPHCKESLPPAPGAGPPGAWVLCLVFTVLIVLADVVAAATAGGDAYGPDAGLVASARVTAAGVQAVVALLALYVVVRAVEGIRRGG